MAASATFALKAGVWFRRARRCMVSPDSQAIACPLSGRNSTYRPVQISGAGSNQPVTIGLQDSVQQLESYNSQPELKYNRLKHAIFNSIIGASGGREELK